MQRLKANCLFHQHPDRSDHSDEQADTYANPPQHRQVQAGSYHARNPGLRNRVTLENWNHAFFNPLAAQEYNDRLVDDD